MASRLWVDRWSWLVGLASWQGNGESHRTINNHFWKKEDIVRVETADWSLLGRISSRSFQFLLVSCQHPKWFRVLVPKMVQLEALRPWHQWYCVQLFSTFCHSIVIDSASDVWGWLTLTLADISHWQQISSFYISRDSSILVTRN